ncbi:F0F1 ATP synthase subunit A [Methylococcus sp. EFPC2]|uniref:F0F1 ATP synthase subunit A n=1 Tax=Methylococcus sp. EFPC2 TaxID=2812648 RepID=UPI001967F74F|nr:F0F1 ATP synthase subunit A [Methylococcus sp. EFPC2]QSA98700.1 F0F1 ATP synthase subunit A [Methylococcus sp. EFPC2]
MELESPILFSIGFLHVSATVVMTWAVMALLVVLAFLSTRRLTIVPGGRQTAVEGIVAAMDEAVRAVAPQHAERILPFIATLWIYLVASNLAGLIPHGFSPNRDLSATAALAVVVFLSVHWFGIRALGFRRYLRHYLSPSPILLPFHLIGEITRTIALAIRLFGNIMSLEIAAALILLVAGFLAPVPILMLHIVEALVQAYIFGILALIYLAGAMQSQEQHLSTEE